MAYGQRFLLLITGVSLLLNTFFLIRSWRQHTVISVPDGDSLQLSDGRRVRLLGLNAPERDQCMGSAARTALTTAAKDRHVRLKNVATDDYGRQLANVIIEDLPMWIAYMKQRFPELAGIKFRESPFPNPDPLLNRMMISRGLARFGSAKNEYYETLKKAQTYAKEKKLGIWSATCRQTTNPECAIKGNLRSGKKVFHLPDCPNYPEVIVDTSFGDLPAIGCAEGAGRRAGGFVRRKMR